MAKITVHYYDNTATRILRTHAYATRTLADRAMARARANGQVSALAGKHTANDPPTCHH